LQRSRPLANKMTLIKTNTFELAINSKGDPNSKKLALILPGRLDTKDYECFNSHLEYLANKGFFAVSFDPPGTWESPGGIELFTTTNYIKAVNELIEYFGNRPTILMGHSRGGTVSILAGADNPYVVSFVLIMANFGEPTPPDPEAIKMGFKISHRDMPPGTSKTEEQKEFILPISYFIDGQKYNVIDVLTKCTKPKLIIYGTNDSFTTPKLVKEIYESVPEPKMIHESNCVHDYRYQPEIVKEVNRIISDFLTRYYTINHYQFTGKKIMYTMPQIRHITITTQDDNSQLLLDKLVEMNFIDYYSVGEDIFYTLDGKLVNQAKFKDIDWKKMKEIAHEKAVKNADESKIVGNERDEFIAIREKVHFRPMSFTDKSGEYIDEDYFYESNVSESLQKYQEFWEKIFAEMQPDDILTHWYIKQ